MSTKRTPALLTLCLVATVGTVGIEDFVKSANAAERPSDVTISFWVADAFSEDPRVITSAVDISTTDGIVTLTGSVRSLAGKQYAAMAARKINGVRGVINNLVVEPVNRPDDDMAEDVGHRLLDSAVIQSPDIGVVVFEGVATLSGEVGSWTERQEAEFRAGEVRGIREVRNELKVVHRSQRSDADIRQEVLSAFRGDVYLSGLPISVTVTNGIVILRGEVGNAYQKVRADRTARTVRSVKDVQNGLTVEWWPERGNRTRFPTPNDKELRTTVRNRLHHDIRIEPFDITVEAANGRVILRGSVPTHYQKKIAEQNARETVGVVWVSNLLSVEPEARGNSEIRADARFEIDSDSTLDGQAIRVAVQGGIVTLSGQVDTVYEKAHAAEITSRIRGVRDVINKIGVKWATKYTDADLTDRIKRQLQSNWETRWVADQIAVSVVNAQATLTGEVRTWGQRTEAGRAALQTEGVRAVNNRLTVAGAAYPPEQWHRQ